MEKYIERIDNRLNKKHPPSKVEKIKKRFLIVGGITIGVGLAGLLSLMICFAVYFVGGDTDTALTCWLIAVPFVIVFIAGAVVTRVGDKLRKRAPKEEAKEDKEEE